MVDSSKSTAERKYDHIMKKPFPLSLMYSPIPLTPILIVHLNFPSICGDLPIFQNLLECPIFKNNAWPCELLFFHIYLHVKIDGDGY